jgi:hypothetical protein
MEAATMMRTNLPNLQNCHRILLNLQNHLIHLNHHFRRILRYHHFRLSLPNLPSHHCHLILHCRLIHPSLRNRLILHFLQSLQNHLIHLNHHFRRILLNRHCLRIRRYRLNLHCHLKLHWWDQENLHNCRCRCSYKSNCHYNNSDLRDRAAEYLCSTACHKHFLVRTINHYSIQTPVPLTYHLGNIQTPEHKVGYPTVNKKPLAEGNRERYHN